MAPIKGETVDVWTDDDERAFADDLKFRIINKAAAIHPLDAAVMLADMSEWLQDFTRDTTTRAAIYGRANVSVSED
jgi:hypothetical protein